MVNEIKQQGLSTRKALTYTDCSNQLYYHNSKPRDFSFDQAVLDKTKEVASQRPSYGSRRMAAMLSRTLDRPVNRKRVQRIFRVLGYVQPAMTETDNTVKTTASQS